MSSLQYMILCHGYICYNTDFDLVILLISFRKLYIAEYIQCIFLVMVLLVRFSKHL